MKSTRGLDLTPTQLKALEDGRWEIWDGIRVRVPKIPKHQSEGKHLSDEKYWVGYNYLDLLELAKQTRNALLAVLAELHRLHFLAWDKKAPIVFSNSTLRSLGFSHHDKIRALQSLETTGWITVQWHKHKSPLVTIVRGFGFKGLGL
jgi:hypothetical protein